MDKNCQKLVYFIILSTVLLPVLFIGIPTNRALALEVAYPAVAGQNISSSTIFPDYIKYLFNLGMFLGFFAVFISLAIAGAMYFLSPIKADLLSSARDRISGSISGMLILVLTYLIVTTINPQLSILGFNSNLPPTPPPPATQKTPGVYFYSNPADCPANRAQLHTVATVPDLDKLKNNVGAVGITQDWQGKVYYISILYDTVGLRGKCKYITITQSGVASQCFPISDYADSPFPDSASIYPYDFYPGGDGVYFYRESCFNKVGNSGQLNNINSLVSYCNTQADGYYKVPNNKIKGIYLSALADLKFTDSSGNCTVPEAKQTCINYDKNGLCTQKDCPSLAGENVSSIIVNGNYLVLFFYYAPTNNQAAPWPFCQEFPTTDDVNRFGPQQIKWEKIRNNSGVLLNSGAGVVPNYVLIIPVQKP